MVTKTVDYVTNLQHKLVEDAKTVFGEQEKIIKIQDEKIQTLQTNYKTQEEIAIGR